MCVWKFSHGPLHVEAASAQEGLLCYLHINLSIWLFIDASVYLSACLSSCLSIYLSIYLSIIYIYLSISISIYIYLSIYLPIYLSTYLYLLGYQCIHLFIIYPSALHTCLFILGLCIYLSLPWLGFLLDLTQSSSQNV